MQYPGVYSLPTAAPIHDENPVMATSYRQPTGITSSGKGGAEPYNTSISGVMQPICVPQDRKLLDQFRDKMRTLHYDLVTEDAYRHWLTNIGSLNSCASIVTVTSGNIGRRWTNRKSRRFLPLHESVLHRAVKRAVAQASLRRRKQRRNESVPTNFGLEVRGKEQGVRSRE